MAFLKIVGMSRGKQYEILSILLVKCFKEVLALMLLASTRAHFEIYKVFLVTYLRKRFLLKLCKQMLVKYNSGVS